MKHTVFLLWLNNLTITFIEPKKKYFLLIMNSMFDELYTEYNYTEMCKKITDKELISYVHRLFPQVNPKILLSVFVFKNFKDDFQINDDMFITSLELCNILKNNPNYDNIYDVYSKFLSLFQEWRINDLDIMYKDITHMTDELIESKIKNATDDYSIQWNIGVDNSVNKLKKSLSDIDVLSKSPPL